MRTDREDTRSQRERLDAAMSDLGEALEDLAYEAKQASKQKRNTRGQSVDMTDVHAAYRAVVRCEEAVDIAGHDLRAARGEDV